MHRTVTLTLILVGGLAACPSARAQSGDRWARSLDLTADQQEQLEQLRYDARKTAISLRADVELAELELRRVTRDPQASESDIDGRVDELARARAELQKHRIHTRRSQRAVLTDEQREKLDELKAERRASRGRRHWRGRPGQRGRDFGWRSPGPSREPHVPPPGAQPPRGTY